MGFMRETKTVPIVYDDLSVHVVREIVLAHLQLEWKSTQNTQ